MTDKRRAEILKEAKRHLANTITGGKEYARTGRGSEWKEAYADIDRVIADLLPKLPNLGVLYAGAKPTLDWDFTHMTSGLGWPAFDVALTGDPGPSTPILAPETMTVDTKDSSASPGEAFYATGLSGIRWWFAHLDRDWPLGTKLSKGVVVGKTLPTTVGGGTHLHLAVNIIPITGRHARYGRDGDGPNYTHGPYTLRTELQRR
jgi:hypothetical protein